MSGSIHYARLPSIVFCVSRNINICVCALFASAGLYWATSEVGKYSCAFCLRRLTTECKVIPKELVPMVVKGCSTSQVKVMNYVLPNTFRSGLP